MWSDVERAGERRNLDQGKNSREVLKAKTVIRWLNLPLKDPAAVGLEIPYKVGINILTELWVVMGGPHSYERKSPTP